MIEFTVPGRAVPAVRMTQRSKYTRRAQRYLAYKKQVGWVARQHYKGGRPSKKPIGIGIKVYLCGGNQGDIDNYFKSIADSLNKIVYEDDRQVNTILYSHIIQCASKDRERVEVEVREMEELREKVS